MDDFSGVADYAKDVPHVYHLPTSQLLPDHQDTVGPVHLNSHSPWRIRRTCGDTEQHYIIMKTPITAHTHTPLPCRVVAHRLQLPQLSTATICRQMVTVYWVLDIRLLIVYNRSVVCGEYRVGVVMQCMWGQLVTKDLHCHFL